jgi:hypothetical protein
LNYVLDELDIGARLMPGLGMDEPPETDDGEMRAVWPGDFDAENILCKGSAVDCDAHPGLRVFGQLWELVESRELLAKLAKCFLF